MTPESTVWSSLPTISSIVNVTAAIGALNAAAMPAAAPTGIRRRTVLRRDAGRARPSELAMPAQICTVGPSRPSDEPVPICSAPRKNLPTRRASARRPPFAANATFTCGMPLPRAFGTTNLSSTPQTSPPNAGERAVQSDP